MKTHTVVTGIPARTRLSALSKLTAAAVIGPFPIAGVYHIYCTLHQGMNLTIVVQ
jgi:plastocyanin